MRVSEETEAAIREAIKRRMLARDEVLDADTDVRIFEQLLEGAGDGEADPALEIQVGDEVMVEHPDGRVARVRAIAKQGRVTCLQEIDDEPAPVTDLDDLLREERR